MKNFLIAILGCAVAGLGAYVVVLKTANRPEPAPQAPPAAATKTNEPAAAPTAQAAKADESKDARGMLNEAHGLIADLVKENKALETKTQPSLAQGIKQIVESPEMKGMIRQGIADQVKRSHAALFRRLGLTPEQEAAMTELLVEQGVAGIETGVQWLTGNHEQSAAQIVASREKLYAEIGQRFGAQALTEYQYWEASKNERDSVTRFNQGLGDEALDEATSDRLVNMMYETRGEFPDLEYLSQPENFNPRDMTPERREDVMVQVTELHKRQVEEAAQVLTPSQLRRYEANLSRQRGELDGFLKFTHGMFNRAQPQPPPK